MAPNGVTHLAGHRCSNLTALLGSLTETEFPQTLADGDEITKLVNYDGRSTVAMPTEAAFKIIG